MALGLYPSLTHVNVFGRNPSLVDGTEEEVGTLEGVMVFPASALMTSISQTSDQVALRGDTVRIIGLDNNFDEVEQAVLLDGSNTTTVMTLGTALRRVNSMVMESTTAITSTVRLHNAGETTDYEIIRANEERANSAIFTVPNNKTAYMTQWWAVRNSSASADADLLDFKLYETDNANSFPQHLVERFGVDPLTGTHVPRRFSPYKKFVEHTDIFITSTPVSTGADVSAGFDLILVDDNDN